MLKPRIAWTDWRGKTTATDWDREPISGRNRPYHSERWLKDHPDAGAIAFFMLGMRSDVIVRQITEHWFSDGSRLELIRQDGRLDIRAYAPMD